ncbi:pyroglutamyl-peptidase I [Cellulomonas endophytica]|uniref:pyroglutamyl-peptidase I family protein n=1 Tax=Cellulomonas endophytica TaxID=2494735 RepID=UPI001F0BD648|nr:pyroglutamyl-peptidase I [Cellulomonas endophytica]
MSPGAGGDAAGGGAGGPAGVARAPAGGAPVLLTAFEPFDGQAVNASAAAVAVVARDWDGPVPLRTATLPVSFARGPAALARLVEAVVPVLVVCVGEAGGRSAVGLERVAVNLVDARIPDADGVQPVDGPADPDGPAARFSSLPVKACVAAARDTGAPAELSLTAGTYVCNAVAYALAGLLEVRPGVRGGFVHVPRLPQQVAAGEPALDAEVAGRALAAVLRTALARAGDDLRSEGTLA